MKTRSRVIFILLLVGLFLVVPFLLARVTVVALNAMYPPAAPPPARQANATPAANSISMKQIEEIKADAAVASEGLEAARAKTRVTLMVVGLYYLIAIPAFIFVRRKQKSTAKQPPQEEAPPAQ